MGLRCSLLSFGAQQWQGWLHVKFDLLWAKQEVRTESVLGGETEAQSKQGLPVVGPARWGRGAQVATSHQPITSQQHLCSPKRHQGLQEHEQRPPWGDTRCMRDSVAQGSRGSWGDAEAQAS